MKKLIVCLCVGLAVGASAEVEYGSLKGTGPSVTIEAGETFTLMANNFNVHDNQYGGLYVYSPPSAETPITLNFYAYQLEGGTLGMSAKNANTPDFGTIAGPCRVQLNDPQGYCSYKITRPDAVVNTSPMNIISLPDDNNGDVELLVESSTDLQNWTPVYSGSAGTSNDAAFFRTRLIQN